MKKPIQDELPFAEFADAAPIAGALSIDELEAIACELMTELIQLVFKSLDARQLVDSSDIAPSLTEEERRTIGNLIDSATAEIEASWP